MLKCYYTFIVFILLIPHLSIAQTDSASFEEIPLKFISNTSKKINNYSNDLTSKTEKTLEKMVKWENKIKSLLKKSKPELANRLFNENKLTFSDLQKKFKNEQFKAINTISQYSQQKDELVTKINYLYFKQDEFDLKFKNEISKAKINADSLIKVSSKISNITEVIRERRKELIEELLKSGELKFLKKINKEFFYYNEKIKILKNSFDQVSTSDKNVLEIMNRIPGCKKFLVKNSEMAGLFGISNFATKEPTEILSSVPIINGISNRISLQQHINSNMPAMQNINIGNFLKSKITTPKNDISNFLNLKKSDNLGLHEFKVNNQKSKPFFKRFEYSFDLQFKNNAAPTPNTTDVGFNVGYKLNDSKTIGIGLGYKLGLGNGLDKLKFSSEGVSLRSFIKWKITKGIDLQGGMEMEYFSNFNKIQQLTDANKWNKLGLLGISKNYQLNKKFKGNFKLFYNVFYKESLNNNQPFIFRTGYSF